MKKKFESVAEMLNATADEESAAEFQRRSAARALTRQLFVLRQVAQLSQQAMGAKLGWSQSRVSKFEASDDGDLRFGDVVAYLAALGLDIGVIISPRAANAVARVKHHALAIKRIADRLAELTAGDAAIARGVAGFFGEAAFNLVRMLQESARKLPFADGEAPFKIEIEVVGEDAGKPAGREAPLKKRRKPSIA